MTLNYLPGCYANLPLAQGESLPGYLLRLAEANGYSGIRDLLSALPEPCTRPVGAEIRSLRADKIRLENLGRMAVGDDKHCLRFLSQAVGKDAAIVQGNRIDHDAWLEPAAQLCPLCLQEKTVIPEEWDLGCVTACERHRVQLLDACTVCGEPITWTRSSLTRCPSCGSDYRTQPAQTATDAAITVSGDFASMARFRYKTHVSGACIATWGSGFELFKFLSLTPIQWANDEFPSAHVRQMSIAQRVAVTQRLSVARVNNVYELPRFAPRIEEMLLPLRVFPRPFVLERYAMNFVASHGSLTPEIAEALVSADALPVLLPGHELFSGRPPSLRGSEAAMQFLGIDNLTYAGLLHWGAISQPPADEPFDVDELLAAQRFLYDELLTMAEQQAVVGVPMELLAGPHEVVLGVWNQRNPADRRAPLVSLRSMHLHLMARWNRADHLSDPVTLREVAMTTVDSIATVIRATNFIATGMIQRFDWHEPYRWADILVERSNVDALLHGAQPRKR